MEIHNIFSNKKEIKKPKQKIQIDYREKNSLVPANLVKQNFEIEFKELKIGDYIVKDVIIERKTIQDFLSSMINKRLIKQIEELQQYDKKIIIIEGFDEQWIYKDSIKEGINSNAIRGFLLSILIKHKIPIIFTKNSEDTAKYISVIANKQEKEMSLKARKKSYDLKEQMQFILESFPSIGPKTARKLLEEFKTLQNIFNLSQENLEKILGKKAKGFKKIINENY